MAQSDIPRGIKVNENVTIPEEELTETFQTSGGPGGQHANRSATGVALLWNWEASRAIDDAAKARLATALGPRGAGGAIRVVADKSRSQWRNRSLARSRLADLVATSLRPPKTRRPTKPTRASKQRRTDAKKQRSSTKALRKPPDVE